VLVKETNVTAWLLLPERGELSRTDRRPPAAFGAVNQITTVHASNKAGAAAVTVSPDGRSLAIAPGGASACGGNAVKVVDTATWQKRLVLRPRWAGLSTGLADINAVAISPNGLFLAGGGREWRGRNGTPRAMVQVWNARTGHRYGQIAFGNILGASVLATAYSPDSHRLATSSLNSTAQVWLANSHNSRVFEVAHGDAVSAVAFSPDGRWLATASYDKTARLWDTRTGQQRLMLTHQHGVYAVAFSPDGRWLATGGTPAYVWDTHTGEKLHQLWTEPQSLNNLVLSVAFSPHGGWLATAGGDCTVRIWDPGTGAQLLKIPHSTPVRAVTLSPDSRWLAASSEEGKVHIWQLNGQVGT